MGAKLIFLTGLLGLGGYVGYKASTYDPAVVPYSRAEVQELLASAKTSMPRRDGDGTIRIWGAGKSATGVHLQMKYDEADWAPLLKCEAVITELGPKESRVVANCGPTGTGSAMADSQTELQAPMFDEFIQSTLQHRAFDRSRATGKEMAVVMKNMGGMQKEALKTHDQMSRIEAEGSASSAANSSSSFNDSTSPNPGAGSGQTSGGWGSDSPGSGNQ